MQDSAGDVPPAVASAARDPDDLIHQFRRKTLAAQGGRNAEPVEPSRAAIHRPQSGHSLDDALSVEPNPVPAQRELSRQPVRSQGIGHCRATPPDRFKPGGKPGDDGRCIFGSRLAAFQAGGQRLGWFFARFFHL